MKLGEILVIFQEKFFVHNLVKINLNLLKIWMKLDEIFVKF